MKQLIEKFIFLERQISTEKGEFSLFALFLQEDTQNKRISITIKLRTRIDREQRMDDKVNSVQVKLAE